MRFSQPQAPDIQPQKKINSAHFGEFHLTAFPSFTFSKVWLNLATQESMPALKFPMEAGYPARSEFFGQP
jgi:hypothetical protein